MIKERKVIHVYIIDQDKHYYFGSMKAIYNILDVGSIGLMYQSLLNYFVANADTDVYENAKCIIRRGVLTTQPTQRGIRPATK